MNEQLLQRLADNIEKQTAVLASLSGNSEEKAASNVMTANLLHGTTGLLSTPGLSRTVISAHLNTMGLKTVLPRVPSVDDNPRFGTITGFEEDGTAEPDNSCDDAPAGFMKGANLTARFGLIRRDTNTIEMDKTMLRVNRGDFKDLTLAGRILGLEGLQPRQLGQSDILNIVTAAEMTTAGVNADRKFVRDIWQGTVAAGTFPGLDSQIATGQVDADTNTLAPALDSDIKDFNYNLVGGTGNDIVEYLSMMEFFLRNNATRAGLDPVTWVIVMRPELWFELSNAWPCAYNTNGCNGLTGQARVFVDGRENIAERDAMRNDRRIDINGNRYQVITDTGIFEHTNVNDGANVPAGAYASSIYMVPLTITGNFPVTEIEYLDYRQALPDTQILNMFGGAPDFFWTDDGMFSWAVEQIKWCYKLALKFEPRVVLKTPQLAGKIQRVLYTPLQHLRDSDPNSPYFANGGVSFRTPVGTTSAVWLT